jgi:uncharacterized protein YdeI (BOF family)
MKLGFAAMLVLAATALSVVATPIQRSIAQNNSPASIPSNIRDLQRVNSVTISGEVVQVRGDEFILRDATGEMLVEAESLAIRQANLKAGDRVTVVGSYDDDNSFETFSITAGNGPVIYVFDD